MIERLAQAFEKTNLGTVVTIKWDRNLKTVELVKEGQAHIAVTGEDDPELAATPIAWDGIAVIVNFANPVKEVTAQQVAALFAGKIKSWSELGGGEARVQLIHRPPNRNIRFGFEQALSIVGRTANRGKVIRSDQKALSAVAGQLAAVTYISLGSALEALQYGIPIHVLMIDGVEAAEQTVKDGRYKLRRPVVLLTKNQPNPVLEAFAAFTLSPEGQKIADELYIPYSH